MPCRKRRKNTRHRGSHTHGWGSKKKHRGSGNRGGRGMAGTGKRAKQKKISILKEYGHEYFGKKGFRRPRKVIKKIKAINLKDLRKFKEKTLDLAKLGYDKLLGKGSVKEKYSISVNFCSEQAMKKIKAAGGSVVLPGKK